MINGLPDSFNAARPGPAALIVVGVTWCGHCQEFKPELASWNLPNTRVYWVDGDDDPRTQAWNIDGYPTILYHPTTGGLYKYNGSRDIQGVRKFIRSLEP
jgi:hypothetical protein